MPFSQFILRPDFVTRRLPSFTRRRFSRLVNVSSKLTKIVFILSYLQIFMFFGAAFANEEKEEVDNYEEYAKGVADEIAKRSGMAVMDNIRIIMDMDGFDEEIKDQVLKPRAQLQIFVSTSMPKSLLKDYAKSVRKYGGVLVFRGLPGGSFREFIDIVMDISGEDTSAIQIDDTIFSEFGINKVPAIVLSKDMPVTHFAEWKAKPPKYDKLYGSIKIRSALEIFASSGDLASDARELLGR